MLECFIVWVYQLPQYFSLWLHQYSLITLFVLLALGILTLLIEHLKVRGYQLPQYLTYWLHQYAPTCFIALLVVFLLTRDTTFLLVEHFISWIYQLPQYLIPWVHQYGAITLFAALTLGIIALPVPEETMMIIAGYLIRQGTLRLIPTLIACILGAWCGITVSYLLGLYIGPYLASTQLGLWLGLQGPRFIKKQVWFNRIGKWSLVIGYFIPGFRHFSGYIAGSLNFPYYQFSSYAYSGAVIWASCFLTAGYALQKHEDMLWTIIRYILEWLAPNAI